MPVQAVFQDRVQRVKDLRYDCAEDGTLLLVLDCYRRRPGNEPLTFSGLLKQLLTLCRWQRQEQVVIGFENAFVEVLTIYHEFDLAIDAGESLMLVCTPPDEYFEASEAA